MNLTIFTSHSNQFQTLADLTIPNKQEYCDRWGAKLVVAPHETGSDIMWDRPRFWLKQIESMQEGDVMWHLATDALITNMEIDWRRNIEHFDLAITVDLLGLITDSFFMSVNERTRTFLKRIVSLRTTQSNEGSAFSQLLAGEPRLTFWLAPQREFNSYLYENYWQYEHMREARDLQPGFDGEWRKGDFVLHLPAMTLEQRFNLIKEYSTKILR